MRQVMTGLSNYLLVTGEGDGVGAGAAEAGARTGASALPGKRDKSKVVDLSQTQT